MTNAAATAAQVAALAALAALAAACGSSSKSPTSSDGGTASDAGGIAGVMCTGALATFPTFDKTCHTADDCAIGVHQTDCCGATKAIGLARSELTRFSTDETLCESQFPRCACPAQATVAEDGRTPIADQMIVVDCTASGCMTTVR